MEVGVGPARYEDLNSDLPVCITQVFLLIQPVTGLSRADRVSVSLVGPVLFVVNLNYPRPATGNAINPDWTSIGMLMPCRALPVTLTEKKSTSGTIGTASCMMLASMAMFFLFFLFKFFYYSRVTIQLFTYKSLNRQLEALLLSFLQSSLLL